MDNWAIQMMVREYIDSQNRRCAIKVAVDLYGGGTTKALLEYAQAIEGYLMTGEIE